MTSFLVRGFRIAGQEEMRYQPLLSAAADLTSTHISVLAGQNGSGKSRILASLANFLLKINNSRAMLEVPSIEDHGLICMGMEVADRGKIREISHRNMMESREAGGLPSRVLAIANLVTDRFYFGSSPKDRPFYFYLGARQSTNLVTTSSVERAVAEALLNMASKPHRLQSFKRWLDLTLQNALPEIWVSFRKLSRSEMIGFLRRTRDDMRSDVARRLSKNTRKVTDLDVETHLSALVAAFEVLVQFDEHHVVAKTGKRALALRIDTIDAAQADKVAALSHYMPLMQRLGYSLSPSVSFRGVHDQEFGHLSSGEQNVLAIGSKLISYAEPGSLILIDEPEISLNVTWQQRYIDLVAESLAHAPGSHVIIATHSPHLISNLPAGNSSVVTIDGRRDKISLRVVDARFEGWGSEAILYQVMGITSASSSLFHKDLANVLEHIQDGGTDVAVLDDFLKKADRLDFAGVEPLEQVVAEIKRYRQRVQ